MPTSAVAVYRPDRLEPLQDPDLARSDNVNLAVGTYVKGTVLGEVTATPGLFKAYATGNSDGSQVPKMILVQACTVTAPTDGTGVNDISYGDPNGRTLKSTPAYYRGVFATADLTGLDAGGLTASGWRNFRGSLTNGKVLIG